jgi:hypothetical protein
VAGRVERCATLEQGDGAAGRQLAGQRLDPADEVVLLVSIDLGPELSDALFPIVCHRGSIAACDRPPAAP